MSLFEIEEPRPLKVVVVGMGGTGVHVLTKLKDMELKGVDYVLIDTDAHDLSIGEFDKKIQIGSGLGAGAPPEIGREAAQKGIKEIDEYISEADVVFIIAGMGGGTGTGASSVIAHLCKKNGALTIGVVSKPFYFEGKRRLRVALEGIEELQKEVDSLIMIPNQRIFSVAGKNHTLRDAFKKADEVLSHAVEGIVDMLTTTSLINLDTTDVFTIMREHGIALMGVGTAKGVERTREAANSAIMSPLLDDFIIKDAKGILINITGNETVKIKEVEMVSKIISDAADKDANIKVGTVLNKDTGGLITVTVIATGFEAFHYVHCAKRQRAVRDQDKALDIPAYLRKAGGMLGKVSKRQSAGSEFFEGKSEGDDEIYNIPSFLRTHMEAPCAVEKHEKQKNSKSEEIFQKSLNKWENELDYFESIKETLLVDEKYKSKFIAIKDKKIIGIGQDRFALAIELDELYPDDVVLIVKVEENIPTVEIPTPEIIDGK